MSNITLESPQVHTTIRPGKGWAALDLLEIWQFRDLLTTLAARDIKLRYRQTALGAIWVILQPLMAAGIFSFIFGKVAKMPSDHVPYFLFAYAGLLGWNAFNSTLGRVNGCLLGNAQLVSKVYFPRLILPLSSVFATLVDFSVAFVMMMVMLLVNGIYPGIGILLLPFWLLLLLMLSVGMGLFASALMVTYRDVAYVVPVLTQFLQYASPVAYAASAVLTAPAVPPWLRTVYMLNPLSVLLEGFKWSLLGHGVLSLGGALYAMVFSIVIFISGAFMFKRMERRFADVI